MKKLLVTALLFTFASVGSASSEAVHGLWKTEPGDSGGYLHVRIAPCDDKLCGEIAAAFDKDDKPVSDYEHLGKQMLKNMRFTGNGNYKKGSIWAPDRDKTYKSKMKLKGDILTVKGCVAFVCRGQTWNRVK